MEQIEEAIANIKETSNFIEDSNEPSKSSCGDEKPSATMSKNSIVTKCAFTLDKQQQQMMEMDLVKQMDKCSFSSVVTNNHDRLQVSSDDFENKCQMNQASVSALKMPFLNFEQGVYVADIDDESDLLDFSLSDMTVDDEDFDDYDEDGIYIPEDDDDNDDLLDFSLSDMINDDEDDEIFDIEDDDEDLTIEELWIRAISKAIGSTSDKTACTAWKMTFFFKGVWVFGVPYFSVIF